MVNRGLNHFTISAILFVGGNQFNTAHIDEK
jgi:hypothetical protein